MAEPKTRRPAFQFYPADWRKDAALQSCSVAAQGLWINAMCIAHECEPYGHLMLNGKPMQAAQLARILSLTAKECQRLLDELEVAGVFAKTAEGTIYSKRMVRDWNNLEAWADIGRNNGHKGGEHGAKGGRPRKGEKPPTGVSDNPPQGVLNNPPPPVKNNPQITPSSSSSSSSSSDLNPPNPLWGNGEHPLFTKFWGVYPRQARRPEAAKAFAAINPSGELLSTILAALDVQRRWPQWVKDNGDKIPFPAKWLSERGWEDKPPEKLRPETTPGPGYDIRPKPSPPIPPELLT